MNKNAVIEIGREKVKNGYLPEHLDELKDMVFTILGYTEADYYGTCEIGDLKKKYDDTNWIYDMKFYQYVNSELVECSFGKAMSTEEYIKDDLFIFSEIEDGMRMYYVAWIINK